LTKIFERIRRRHKLLIMQELSAKIRTVENGVISTASDLTTSSVKETIMANASLPTNFRTINLSQGKVAIVDAEDYERVNQFKWYATKMRRRTCTRFYACRTIWLGVHKKKKHEMVFLHRFIMNAPAGVTVDHANRDPLDCRKSNLRFATPGQQVANRVRPRSKSGFIGVIAHRRKYRARMRHDRATIHVGYFTTAEAAARAYDMKAVELRGAFAVLNFPDDKEKYEAELERK
jgi:hypothetical protein